MTDHRKPQLLSLLVLVTLASVTWATDPNHPASQLTFEQHKDVLPRRRMALVEPRFAAGVTPQPTSGFFPRLDTQDVLRFLTFAGRQNISVQQKRFLTVNRSTKLLNDRHRPEDANGVVGTNQTLLYAMTSDDARKMAQAYLQFARNEYDELIQRYTTSLKTDSEKLRTTELRITELQAEMGSATNALESLRKTTPYRSIDQATTAIAEFDKTLYPARIEAVGIQARIKAIQQHQERCKDPGLKDKLETMFVEESIALQGIEAQIRMANTLRKQADEFVGLNRTLTTASNEERRCEQVLANIKKDIERTQRQLADMREREPKILDNKVFIYQLRN